MKGLFIPEITAEMFRNGCLEGIEALMAEGEIYDIDYTGWIPCSERLPKIGEQVLCCDSQSRVFTSALTEIASNGMTFFGQHCKVIAWRPLPEPYREDGLPIAEAYSKDDLIAKLEDEFGDVNRFTIKRIYENWLK